MGKGNQGMGILNTKVFVGMSGGVDSSVAAALLKEKGYDVIGAHMKCFNVDGCAEQDAEDARRAAEGLGIPFYVFDFEKEYKDKVVEYMIDGYRNGITPNPDVMCNKEIKFGLFLKKTLAMGADYVATGHYVRLREVKSEKVLPAGRQVKVKSYALYSAEDKNKDQSYFLWTLTQKQLKHCLFPIGNYLKSDVRKMAGKFNLLNANKKDSQGICFLGQVDLKDFLKKYIPEKKGVVLNTKGKVVGEHKGAWFYTIGQRGGLGIGGNKKPYYIAEKDMEENALLVAEAGETILNKKEVILKNINFINLNLSSLIRANSRIDVLARVRYRQPLAKATLVKSGQRQAKWKLVFEKPQKFVACGQSAVFYQGNPSFRSVRRPSGLRMLGGGIII